MVIGGGTTLNNPASIITVCFMAFSYLTSLLKGGYIGSCFDTRSRVMIPIFQEKPSWGDSVKLMSDYFVSATIFIIHV